MARRNLADAKRKGRPVREGHDPAAGPDREGQTVVDARDASRAGAREATGTGATESGATESGADHSTGSRATEPRGVRLAVGDQPSAVANVGIEAGSDAGSGTSEEQPTWRGYAREHGGYVVAAVAVLMLAVIGFIALTTTILGGSEEQPAPERPQAPAAGEAGSGVPAAEDVGGIRQDRDGSTVTVSIAPDGGSYRGELSDAEDSLFLESEANQTQASFVSPFAEGEERSWLGQIKDASHENFIIQASQTTDPGPAAAEGRSPFMRGSYTVKARDGSLSASGSFEDVFVSPTKLERTYTETYFASDSGTATPERRQWKVRYESEGDPAFVPTLIGYELPSGQKIGASTEDAPGSGEGSSEDSDGGGSGG